MKTPLNVLLFGGCLTHTPLRKHARGGARLAAAYHAIPQIHTFGEMFQIVDILRGEKVIPPEIRPLCRIWRDLGPVPNSRTFDDIDVALVEPSSPIEITFRGFSINRRGLRDFLVEPMREQYGREAGKVAAQWFRVGLVGLNEKMRAESAPRLLNYLKGDDPDTELRRAIVLEIEATTADIAAGLERIHTIVDRPLGVVIYVFRYMPDGRPITWDGGFQEQLVAAAREFGLPLFDPAPYVKAFGVEAAMIPESAHYTDAFGPVIADALTEFSQSVYDRTSVSETAP